MNRRGWVRAASALACGVLLTSCIHYASVYDARFENPCGDAMSIRTIDPFRVPVDSEPIRIPAYSAVDMEDAFQTSADFEFAIRVGDAGERFAFDASGWTSNRDDVDGVAETNVVVIPTSMCPKPVGGQSGS